MYLSTYAKKKFRTVGLYIFEFDYKWLFKIDFDWIPIYLWHFIHTVTARIILRFLYRVESTAVLSVEAILFLKNVWNSQCVSFE